MLIKRNNSVVEKQKKEIISLLRSTRRPGMESLISWLEDSDYFTAQGSLKEKGHDMFEGGLAAHCLSVYNIAMDLYNGKGLKDTRKNYSKDSIILASLLHDLCKVNASDFEHIPGHGSKSLEILDSTETIKLTEPERDAIRYHMGPWYDQSDRDGMKAALKKSGLWFLIHMSDTISSMKNKL